MNTLQSLRMIRAFLRAGRADRFQLGRHQRIKSPRYSQEVLPSKLLNESKYGIYSDTFITNTFSGSTQRVVIENVS